MSPQATSCSITTGNSARSRWVILPSSGRGAGPSAAEMSGFGRRGGQGCQGCQPVTQRNWQPCRRNSIIVYSNGQQFPALLPAVAPLQLAQERQRLVHGADGRPGHPTAVVQFTE